LSEECEVRCVAVGRIVAFVAFVAIALAVVDVDPGEGATYNVIDNDCDGATGDEVDDADDDVHRRRRRHQLDDKRRGR